MDKAAHFDLDALEMLQEIMEEEFSELVQVYIADSQPRIAALRQALAEQSAEEMRELAHSFKGASSNLSALPLADLCFKVECAGRDNSLQNIEVTIDLIEQEFQQVSTILNDLIS